MALFPGYISPLAPSASTQTSQAAKEVLGKNQVLMLSTSGYLFLLVHLEVCVDFAFPGTPEPGLWREASSVHYI